jgi:RNA polymerase-associated protein CTR9
MFNLSMGRLDQARFFFDTTLKHCGQVLPALLGMAAVLYGEEDFKGAQDFYAKAMRLYPEQSGAAARVGFGLTCYRLGQVDRAKAAFSRALEMDAENVDAMVGSVLLDMASLDDTARDYRSRMENSIKMMSVANLLDHSNAMVQNHLANHLFWRWTPVSGTVELTHGSKTVKGSQPMPLDPNERIRIGSDFETQVADDVGAEEDEEEDNTIFQMKDAWTGPSTPGLKLWKKDYDRVIALAKGAYNSTAVKEIQAESIFLLARVNHVRGDIENASRLYEEACKLAPNLSPARFGLAQTLIAKEEFKEAVAHLKLVLGTSANAVDALALLGLLLVKSGKEFKDGLACLKKAIDLDPLNSDFVMLEALALQQQKVTYPQALERYKKAVKLLESQRKPIPYELLTNIGVLCHETAKYDEALAMYVRALEAMDGDDEARVASLDNIGVKDGLIRHKDNFMFNEFVDTHLHATSIEAEGGTTLKLNARESANVSAHSLVVGDRVRLGDDFESDIVEIVPGNDGTTTILIREAFISPSSSSEAEDIEAVSVAVRRENRRLENPPDITIAFNIARLHEATGRSLAAVELHKAILKRNPAYVNSYLRLACIARDCGSLRECSSWLKIAVKVAPGNPEVLTLVGNLHLSLCDWEPAQRVFDQLLTQKVPNVDAYSQLSLGNIYFANLRTVPEKYAKHLQYAADFYKRILAKDNKNAYAANGIGTVLAERGDLFKAKEVFNRVREVSGDTIADAHLNLGHIYLAQKKHPEALAMYQSYMRRTQDGTAPITTKSREDDVVEVLLYIAFAYYDWARQTELFNNERAAPADERYRKCIEHLELALKKSKKKDVIIQYNLCKAKLAAANCVLQKLTRNIRRTAQEVEDAITGLEESLPKVQEIMQWKLEKKKIPISTNALQEFITHCRANLESAKSHLTADREKEKEAETVLSLQREEAESKMKMREIELEAKEEEEKRLQEERDRKAEERMKQVEQLRSNWEKEAEAKKAAAEKRKANRGQGAPEVEEESGLFDDQVGGNDNAPLFEDSDDDDDDGPNNNSNPQPSESAASNNAFDQNDTFGETTLGEENQATTEKELFGDSSSDESDDELIPTGTKRANEEPDESGFASKKRRVMDDDDDE